MNLRFIETIGWVVFYGAFVVFALTVHTVSPIYRAVFIDQTVADWLPDTTRRYVPPDAILGKELSPYFGNGWWSPESDMRWGKGGRSTIVVQPTRSLPYGSRVKGRIGALLGRNRANQTIIIEVNGIEVDRLDFSVVKNKIGEDIKTFDAQLPTSFAKGGQVEITFVVPDATSPFLMHQSNDLRQLGVCFFELALVPQI
jgi:hypothetical protein